MNDPLLNPNDPLLPKKEEGQSPSVVELSSDAVVLNTTRDSVPLKAPKKRKVPASTPEGSQSADDQAAKISSWIPLLIMMSLTCVLFFWLIYVFVGTSELPREGHREMLDRQLSKQCGQGIAPDGVDCASYFAPSEAQLERMDSALSEQCAEGVAPTSVDCSLYLTPSDGVPPADPSDS